MDNDLFEFCWNQTNFNAYPECMDLIDFQQRMENRRPKIVPIIFMAVLILLCVIGNLLVIIAFAMYRRLRVITHYYIVSLAISDLLVGLISMPIWLTYEITGFVDLPDWINGVEMIDTMEFIEIVSCISSIVNLAAISIDRFFGIVMPLRHKTLVTEKNALFYIAIVWIYSFTVAGMKFAPRFRDYMIFNFIAGYAVPLLIICGCYLFIFIQVKKHSKKKLSNQTSKQWTLARTILVVISMVVVCWTPFFVVVLLYQYCLSCTFFEESWFEHVPGVIKMLHYFNSCCNPFIYGVFNIKFRSAYKGIIYKCLGKELKQNTFEVSTFAGSRNASIRNRSNTCASVISYAESQSPGNVEADELLSASFDRTRSSSLTRQESWSNSKLPKPLSPKILEDEPRLLLRQKFQQQTSLEQYSPMQQELEFSSLLTHSSFNESSSDEEEDFNQICFVESFQSSTLLEIDSLLAEARESDII